MYTEIKLYFVEKLFLINPLLYLLLHTSIKISLSSISNIEQISLSFIMQSYHDCEIMYIYIIRIMQNLSFIINYLLN